MNFRILLTAGFAAMAMSLMAQTHAEGEEYYKADQIENAKTLLERNLNNSGTDKAVSYYYLGQIAMDENKPGDASKYFDMGLQANPDYPYNYVGKGFVALKNGDKQLAEKNFKEAESKGKKIAGVQIAIARAYYDVDPTAYQSEIDKRIAKARKIDIEDPDAYIFEGDMLRSQKDWGGAGAKYEMAANYDNNATGAYVKYANLFTQVNPQYAINMLTKLLQANPDSALGQRELANAYYNNNNFAQAAEKYAEYIKNPNHFKEDEDRYAFLLFYDNKYADGYRYATNLLSQNPDNFSALRYQFMNAAQLPEMADQLPAMAEKLYAAHTANPSANKFAPIDFLLIADEYSKAKQLDKAVAVLQEAISTMPDNSSFDKALATVYLDNEDYGKAADAYLGFVDKTKDAGYNEYTQEALYAYFGGAQNLLKDPELSKKYFAQSTKYANMAQQAAPAQYKPYKILGDIAVATAAKEDMSKAGANDYQKAIELMEAKFDPRYKADAKTMYNYMGNYYLDQKDVNTAKTFFNKYLELDPDNADYRKFVEGLK